MEITIRQEIQNDFEPVSALIKNAFERELMSNHQEHVLVARLRESTAFVPELSLVAQVDNRLVGYILLAKINIISAHGDSFPSLALAPVAVLPQFQGKGIGARLIETAHHKARGLGFGSVIVLGHAAYYPKFGYRPSSEYGIRLPFDVPDENSMAIALTENALANVSGIVQYPEAFGIG